MPKQDKRVEKYETKKVSVIALKHMLEQILMAKKSGQQGLALQATLKQNTN